MSDSENGNPDHDVPRRHKRLVILCDGSWQSADKPLSTVPSWPTNIVRLTRAIKPTTIIRTKSNDTNQMVDTPVDQITYYQSGVGTGFGSVLGGGMFGMGLSEKIRNVYGFLANNYVEGDTIAIFGFSRGAYTARAIGGLLTGMGLLSKRGMDNFKKVYNDFYNADCDEGLLAANKVYRDQYGLYKLEDGTIEVIGVFDTVGFHNPINSILPAWIRNKTFIRRALGEQYELKNTELPHGVKYAFHALSLDEVRFTFRPTLWFQRRDEVRSQSQDPRPYWDHSEHHQYTLLEQVWFSGTHSQVGGGLENSALSDVAFGWMASQLTKYKLLDLDPEYLLIDPNQGDSYKLWATKHKLAISEYVSKSKMFIVNLAYFFLGLAAINWLTKQIEDIWGVRTPGRYVASPAEGRKRSDYVTNEYFHASINDRNMEIGLHRSNWPCIALRDFKPGNAEKAWTSNDGLVSIKQAKIGDVEKRCKNNLRDLMDDCKIPLPINKTKSEDFFEGVADNEGYVEECYGNHVVNGVRRKSSSTSAR